MMTDSKIPDSSNAVLHSKLNSATNAFEMLKKRSILQGDFYGSYWKYKGKNLHFTQISNTRSSEKEPLSDLAGSIARCYTLDGIENYISGELAVSRLNSFRRLAENIGKNDKLWAQLNSSLMNKTIDNIRKVSSEATTYHRATALNSFVQYMNRLGSLEEGEETRFNGSFIRWKHNLKNPIQSSTLITSSQHALRKENLYEPDLHIALGKARNEIKIDLKLEPRRGYDLIRLESLSFAMSLGLRIGEICSLSIDSYEKDEDNGLCYVRVATEKGGLGGATAVAESWQEALSEANTYLLEECVEARTRAREIEKSGFSFIKKTLSTNRAIEPLLPGAICQMAVLELDSEDHYFISEIVGCFEVSSKEFSQGGRYSECLVSLPRYVSSTMVHWIDARIQKWDWAKFSTSSARSKNKIQLSVYDIGKQCGASRASITKASWFVEPLRKFLDTLKDAHVFEGNKVPSASEMIRWKNEWNGLRELMLERRGGAAGAPCVVVNIKKLCNLLSQRYAYYLSVHFREQFYSGTDHYQSQYIANNLRPGQEANLSNHLIVVWENQFTDNIKRGIIPRPILRSDYYNYLCNKSEKRTIFERLNIRDSSGNFFSISPHQIRRWVTTALLRSGPSEAAIDLWMGRQPRQTRQYDYRTAKERAEYVRSKYVSGSNLPSDFLGKKVVIWREQGLTKKQIEILVTNKLKVLNFSPWGGCSRELYLSPCAKGLMCLKGFGTPKGCSSFHLDLTDKEAKDAISNMHEKYHSMLTAVEPNYKNVSKIIYDELDTTQPLDQHIAFLQDMVSGCEAALIQYAENEKNLAKVKS